MLGVLREEVCIRPGNTVLAAVSGGADSVALLLLLYAVQREAGIALRAAHYEHGIRGEASRADAAFVQALCERLMVPCSIRHGDVPALKARWRCSMEDAARRARYAFFEEAAAQTGARFIALAHQQEDQAETLLLHLVHGAGLQGLAAMRARQGNRIRPLLGISRRTLEAYLLEKGQSWREDASNDDTKHARNLLRHEVFPVLQRLNPGVHAAMGRTAVLAAQAYDALRCAAEAALESRTKTLSYGAFWEVQGQSMPSEAIRLFAQEAGVPPLGAVHVRSVRALCPGQTANLPGDWRALRTKTRLHLLSPDPRPYAVNPADFHRSAAREGFLGDGIRSQVFDAQALDGAAFRTRRPGDTFAPLGAGGMQKLKQTLIDAGIDRPFRDLLPVLAKGSRILWVVGLKPSRDAAIGTQTRARAQLCYCGDLPWETAKKHDGGLDQC